MIHRLFIGLVVTVFLNIGAPILLAGKDKEKSDVVKDKGKLETTFVTAVLDGKDAEGLSPLQCAERLKNPEVIRLLKAAGAMGQSIIHFVPPYRLLYPAFRRAEKPREPVASAAVSPASKAARDKHAVRSRPRVVLRPRSRISTATAKMILPLGC